MTDAKVLRPNAIQWLRYVYTGSVPAKNHAWVLYDATCSTWVLRHAVRYLVLAAPLITAVMFLPTSLSIRLGAAFSAAGSMLIGYLCFTTESLEHRVEKAGYPWGLAGWMREQRVIDAQRTTAARNRARRDDRWAKHHVA